MLMAMGEDSSFFKELCKPIVVTSQINAIKIIIPTRKINLSRTKIFYHFFYDC